MEENRSVSPQEAPAVASSAPPAAPAPAAPSPSKPAPSLWGQVLRVAWLSIVLGLVLEMVVLMIVAYSGNAGSTPKPFISDLAQKVSWGFIVCVGIAFGTTASRAREALMGVLGLISAPAGFAIARATHKAVNEALDVAGPAAAGASPFLLGGLKGLEYAVLGFVIGWVGKKAWGGLGAHVTAGILIGLTFGSAILWVMEHYAQAPAPPVALISRGVNELLFPLGCSLVLYASGVMSKKLPLTP
ncbi:MAG TPA: hypothetical protein VF756_05655 [Thermoanaerobaculia bacterium]